MSYDQPGLLTKFVDSAYGIYIGAHKLFGVFRKCLRTPSEEIINEEAQNMYTSNWKHLKFLLKRKFSLTNKTGSPEQPTSTTTMEKLPIDVLPNIFIRLLAKQVGQMRCVCKTWNARLSESSFVRSHLDHSIHNNNDNILLFVPSKFSFMHSVFIARSSHSPYVKLKNFIKLPLPLYQFESNYGNVIGSVNGLICFTYGVRVHIWNPSLSVVSTLPPCSLPNGGDWMEKFCRFGYDPKTYDYKVVKVISLTDTMLPEVEVYSMRKGLWEVITERFPLNIRKGSHYNDVVCADGREGHLHWLCDTDLIGEVPKIVAFDLGKETFRQIHLPDPLHHIKDSAMGVLGGKLCVMLCIEDGDWGVWVMEESESWVKHRTFSYFKRGINPCGFTSRGEFLFQSEEDDYYWFLYDPVADETVYISGGRDDTLKILEYVDSLVSVAPDKHEHEHKICSISKFQCVF